MNGIIYKVTNKINGREYVGQTIQKLEARKWRHLNDTMNGSDCYFHRALKKYGINNFNWNVVENIKSNSNKFVNILNYREQHFIKYFDTFKNGYNLTTGGLNCLCSEETKLKQKIASTGRKHSEESKIKMSKNNGKYWLGKCFSDEHKKAISKGCKNVIKTKEWNEKNSKAHCKILWFVQTPIKNESNFWCFNLKNFAKTRKLNFGWLSSNHSCKGYKVEKV